MVFESIEPTELIALIIVLAGYIPVIIAFKRRGHVKWLFAAYTALLIGVVATVLEGFIYPVALNYVEHGIGIGLAGVLFFYCAYANREKVSAVEEETREKLGEAHG